MEYSKEVVQYAKTAGVAYNVAQTLFDKLNDETLGEDVKNKIRAHINWHVPAGAALDKEFKTNLEYDEEPIVRVTRKEALAFVEDDSTLDIEEEGAGDEDGAEDTVTGPGASANETLAQGEEQAPAGEQVEEK